MRIVILAACALFAAAPALAGPLSPTESAQVNKLVGDALARSGAPSASIAIVRDGKLAYAKAYGLRRLAPAAPAVAQARYDIGSVSKQFTAAAILLLAEDGKLSLDDKVGRFLPRITGAGEVTIRQLLSQTAGYRTFWTVDYLPLYMQARTTPQGVIDRWGTQPLDFAAGAKWDYSNTNYTIAGRIVEIVAGEPLERFLQRRIFQPLGMNSAGFYDGGALGPDDAVGYTRFALGPVRTAPLIPPGWVAGAGGLAMTAEDLAKWDISIIERSLLKPASYDAQQAEGGPPVQPGVSYGLGVYVDKISGRRRVHHDGSAMGFLTENRIYPDDKAAVVVTVNSDLGSTFMDIAGGLQTVLFGPPPAPGPKPTPPPAPATRNPDETALARSLYEQVRTGTLERSQLTADANAFFSGQVLADYRDSLAKLPEPTAFTRLKADRIAGLDASLYELTWPNRKLIAILRLTPEGKVEEFVVFAPD